MQDLRLIGVHEDGQRLLLAGPDGEHYTVALDDALRVAARRDRPRLGQLQIEMEGGMRPKDVQSMVRAGATAHEVAERSGWDVEKVRKYEVPILAERVHVADQARQVRVRSRSQTGSVTPTLQGRVGQRMRDRGVDPETSSWDAWRGPEDIHWTVVLTFAAGGRQRQAAWAYDPVLRSIEASDDEARWLSADAPAAAGPLADATARETNLYDVEAQGGVATSHAHAVATARSGRSEEPLDLMTAMRQRSTVGRRSRRRGGQESGRRVDIPAPASALPLEDVDRLGADVVMEPAGAEIPPLDENVATVAERLDLVGQAEDDEPPRPPEPLPEPGQNGMDGNAAESAATKLGRAGKRKPRTSVPSWDDIMFGARRDS